MNRAQALLPFIVLLMVVLACDSPPWSRFIVANSSNGEVTVRFYTEYTFFAAPCVYSAEEWKANARSCSGTPQNAFKIEENQWLEIVLQSGEAVEINRAPYPEIERDVEGNFLIDRLDITGSSGSVSWTGRQEIFNKSRKEDTGYMAPSFGQSPRFVIYYQ